RSSSNDRLPFRMGFRAQAWELGAVKNSTQVIDLHVNPGWSTMDFTNAIGTTPMTAYCCRVCLLPETRSVELAGPQPAQAPQPSPPQAGSPQVQPPMRQTPGARCPLPRSERRI